jgi:antitoxin component of MazEF toxin-antitoxin module
MVKTLIQHGNSAALIIDKAILELLNITLTTPLEVKTDGEKLIISPVRDTNEMRPEVRAAYEKVIAKRDKVFKRLAQ